MKQKRNVWKRMLAMVLVCMMLLSKLPSTLADVFAADIVEYTMTVTDYAENVSYISSDGYIVDSDEAKITLTPDETEIYHEHEDGTKVGVYNNDVNVQIDINDEDADRNYSGIQKVEYWVTCDGEETQRELLKSEFSKVVTVDAEKNNSCNVVLYVQVIDNTGLVTNEQIPLDIDITEPTIQVSFDNNEPVKVVKENEEQDRGYFDANRTATVIITERAAHFEAEKATAGIKISGVKANGENIPLDTSEMIKGWTPVDTGDADEATHTATVAFETDANYTFDIRYTDKAMNANIVPIATDDSVTPYYFTVDKLEPNGTITVENSTGKLGFWYELIETLTFGLWSKTSAHVAAIADDEISPIESVDYYKTAATTALTEIELNDVTDWTVFSLEKGFDVKTDEQFAVYLRIVDYAGHVKYISSNGIIVDDTQPIIDGIKPEITITPVQPVNGIYNTDVDVYVKVVDSIEGGTYAGLKEIRYEVYNMDQSQTVPTQGDLLYKFAIENPTQDQLLQSWEKQDAIRVSKEVNNSNNVIVKVYAVDNAGNENAEQISLMIDATPPSIHISYDNNAGDTTVSDDVYFKENRTATVVITERNFNPADVDLRIVDTHGNTPAISGWTTVTGTGNKDNTTHTARITYAADGDYTFAISCKDKAGNTNTPVDTGNSLAPYKFTIDKTVPTVSIAFDNTQSLNGNYYKAKRTMTITVHEHNFETSRVKVTMTATDEGRSTSVPSISGWSSSGDTHKATITFAEDALYTFDFAYTDKAGNQAADVKEEKFYVDKTKPVVEILEIEDESANNEEGNIGFRMEATDTNFDVFKPMLTAVIRKGNSFVTEEWEIGSFSTIARGKAYTVTNIDTDGIYRITCTVVDKAGNEYEKIVWYDEDGTPYEENRSGTDTLLTFSVNREGSTYEVNENTTKAASDYYIQRVWDDVVIDEINADILQEYEVILNNKVLKENIDYKVTEDGGNGSWMKYHYTISKDLFENEGEYILVISSKDKADNNAFSDVKEASIHFVVDRTAPVVAISGLTNNGRYETEKQKVTLIPTDDGGVLKSLIVQTVNDDGKLIKELVNLSGEDLEMALQSDDGKISFEVEQGLYQNVKIICDDAATYENEDNILYETTITNVTVIPNKFLIFWSNTTLRYSALLLLLLSLCVTGYIVYKKRKQKNKEKQ